MQEISKSITGLSQKKRELLNRLLQERGVEPSRLPIIPRPRGAGHHPLSFAQQRLWFIDRLIPGSSLYNMPLAVRLGGRLDVDALRRTLSEVLRRHEALRTTFEERDGLPVQIIQEATPLPLEVEDLRGGADAEAEVRRLAAEEGSIPFDLLTGPLLRGRLLWLGDEEHVLLLTMHHIVSDGWSVGVLIREVAALYSAYVEGRESPLPELEVQYADYAAWQREHLAGEALERQLKYWRKQLGGGVPALELPTDKPRPAVAGSEGASVSARLGAEAAARLRELSRREGATFFMVLLAGWQALLSRYTRQEDIAVGTPIAGRGRAEVEPLIGFFVNTLVLRTDLSGDPSFAELLGRVKEVTLGAYAHQEVPYERLVEELQTERDLSRDGLFQVMLVLQNAPSGALELPGLKLSPAGVAGETAKFELTLTALEAVEGVSMSLEYRTELFTRETAGRMLGHLVRLLEEAGAAPELRLSRLPLMTEAERREVVEDWNQTQSEFERGLCLHELFEAQAARTPGATAVAGVTGELTYGELNASANRVAHRLRATGVGAECRVGVLMERSPEMFVALLGILKAGAAYVPLDPTYPQERLDLILKDSGAAAVLTQARLLERLPEGSPRALCLDADRERFVAEPDHNPPRTAGVENIAYIIYTSGSTGTPKGVMTRHRSLVNYVRQARAEFRMGPEDRVLQFASVSFDASAEEIFVTLTSGATLVLRSEEMLSAPAVFLRACRELSLTVLDLPTAYWHELVVEAAAEDWRGADRLRLVIIGGERALPERVARWRELGDGSPRLVNTYGPTEATIVSTLSELSEPGGDREDWGEVPIGRPLGNMQAYVLDAHVQPAPLGVAGELHIGGEGLARGYLGRPGLTAEKFIPDPFSREPGARLYRTGDLTRFLPDGQLEYLGRMDGQVKVRGFRIELREVETALALEPAVKDCVVLAREDAPGDKRLVAYVVGRELGPEMPPVLELRENLRRRLPEYMVPTHFVVLERLPTSSSGKVDRRALPAPEQTRADLADEYLAPRTPTEEIIAGIWARVLKVAQVGVQDNFFALGGHSLLATQVISRVRSAFGVEPPLRSIFERPTVAGLAEVIEGLMHGGGATPQPPLVRAERSGELPVSFAQQRLWFLDRLLPGSSLYNMPLGVRLSGRLDVGALSRTLSEVVRRHEALRTTFAEQDGQPVQVIHEAAPVPLEVEDLSALGSEGAEAEAVRLLTEESRTPFDLAAGPMLRARLLRLSEDDHVALLTMHHIVSDGWSIGVFIDEVAALYSAYAEGKESPLPELQIQYTDYAVWQRGWLQGEALESHLKYWREKLGGGVPALEVPTDFARPAVAGSEGASVSARLGAEAAGRLRELSRREGTTLFMTLLAGWQALLSRYTGQEDIAVGTPVAGRGRAEVESLIGLFLNTLVLRTDLSGDPSFSELLGRVREVSLGAYAHQDVPYERLVEELQTERDLSRDGLFQAMLVLQNAPGGELELPGLKLSPAGVAPETAKFELTLTALEAGDELLLSLNYRTELFQSETAGRMLRHLVRLLEGASADPGLRVGELELMSQAERRQVVEEWNDTAKPFPTHLCLHELFEAQAARTPHAPALTFEGSSLSYEELNARANRLARHLVSLGVGPEALVGVLMERSTELVVALLGVLKAGGAYLPLDPSYPMGRLTFMLEDAGVGVLLTQGSILGGLPEAARAALPDAMRVLCLDTQWGEVARHEADDFEAGAGAGNLAYVIYTSGSTGTPKGVMITHGAICNHMRWMLEEFSFTPEDSVLQKTPAGFDASVWEFYAPLLSGGRLVVARPGAQADHAYLLDAVRGERVTTLQVVPAMLRLLVGEREAREAGAGSGGGLAGCGSLRRVFCGGEALPRDVAERFAGEARGARLYNLYGPTEATIDALWCECTAERVAGGVPLGRAVANTRVYVLDGRMRAAPAGVAGELYLGGAGLARGYLNRPALTAERFVPDPFSGESGARLYRTGDVGRHLAGGEVDFLGRADHQVKIRGYRIELGEVEAAVRDAAWVRDCAVVAREEGEGDRRLVAYVVAEGGREVDTAGLREGLSRRLPGYMVPSHFVMLEALPLTPNGKLDRKALPAPGQTRDGLGGEYMAPRTPAEEMMANIWAGVLKVAQVGVQDNFFALGGHSLLATQVISRVRSAFGVEPPLRTIFERPTVAGLTGVVEELMRGGGASPQPPLVRAERSGELPVSFAQQRLWFLDRLIPGSPVYNMPLAVRLSGRLDVGALSRTLSEVVRRHEALRTTFGERDGEPVQVIHEPEPLNLEVEDLSMLDSEGAEAEAVRLLTEESRTPFDLAAGPLLRARLLRLSEDDHVALLTMHHIVSDGWSIGVFIDEVAALYSAYAEGKESPLPELEVQYADYAAWQRDWLQGEALESHLKYWREKLGGGVPALEVPTDFARPAVAGSEGASVLARMGAAAAGRLRELSRREGVTMFMTLLAGWQALLSRYTGQEDIAVGTPVAGRNRAEVEGLIGFFVNTLVLRTDLSGDPSFTELLGRVREVSLGAYAHQDVPYEKLVEEFQPERDLSRDGLFQAMLVLQNAPGGELLLPGLKLSPAGAASETAKFELTLTAAEAGDDLLLSLNYRTELFTGEMAGRMLEHLVRLLEGAGADPGLRVGELELMSEAERRQVIFEWNDTAEPFSSHLCLHEFFERQVSRTPDAVALSFEGRHLSYAELDARANRLARHLRGLGVGPEVLVGVMMRRSTEMVVALMGILKAGGAYVPIDLAYPPERVAFMLEDSGARVLLTESALAHSLAGVMARAVHLDVEAEVIAGRSAEPVESGAGAENLAYVIYTSGSTGTPKGVAIRHRAAAALLCWARSHFGADSLACVLASTSISFDLSVFELFVTLGCGGRVALAHDALGLPAVAASEAVTLVNTVPSAMAELVRAGGLPGSVRVVNLAGEPLARQLVEEVYGGGGVEQVWNLYGPSEDTTYSTFALARVGAARGPSIGRAVANTRVYVLDGRMRAAPAGVAGELYLGGAGLARGYLNRPALTAERFVPDPFSGEPGARLYRTGDVGRHLAGGEVDFLGRADDQVKIRGYRIELGEVEAAVRDAAWVRDCAVVAREEGEGDRRLVAYVVAEGGREVDTSQLRESLGARLPGYMVPSHFVMLEALPLTPNGKVDRKALPAPGQTRDGLGGEYVAPRTSTEEIVAGIWARVLKVAQVGMEDNFFALGGHSLLATQVISRVRSAFGVEPPLRSIFERPTVAGLTGVVEELMRGGGASPQPPLVRAERSGELPVSFAQQRLWFLDRLIPGSSVYNMPLAVRLSGRLDVGALSRTLSEVVRRHEALRTTFGERDGHPVQVVHEHEALRIEVEDLGGCAEPEAEARRLAAAESRTPFDLAAGPLLRTRLLRLSDEEHVVLLTMHHIVSDGWSIGVFIDEVAALYSAYAEGKESPLPELEVQYADYAAWQRGWLQGEALERQLEYWRGRLGGVPALEVPTDFARPAVAGSEGASVSARLGAEAAGRLRELSRREGVTMFMTLLAGWQALLSRYTGQEDIAVGTPVAGRNRAEVEGLIGFFVNTLVLRTDLSGDPTFRELLGRVREVSLGAYAHQDVPYEKLVEEVSGERDLSRGALFQAMLVLQNAPGGELLLPGLKLSPAGAAGETAKFELTLTAAESDDGLSLSLNYRTELFTGETAGRMLRHLVRVLEGAGADAGRRLSELELMSEDERREMVEGWNRTRAEFERGRCVHELFEAQAARTPDAAAVEFGGETLTYGELNASANRVAHRLREMGVGPEARVAVLLERSAELVVALLGVMKAGAAYVPLDPASPARRHASVVEDARAEVVVTREEFLGVLPHAAVALCLDRDRGQIEACGARDPEPATAPDNLAYVIYTSGSTGTPKGVMVQHRSVLNLWAALRAAVPAYGGERLRVSLNAPVTFDASVKQIVQLLSGHTLCVVPEGVRRDAAALREYVARERVDVLDCTPAQLRLLLEGGWAAGRPRAVLAGGEALDEGLWGRMRGDAATVYVNLYGPTECTVDATACVARGGAVRPSIGRPLANTRVYIVDGRLRPAPAGVTGELLVGGEGVARGYLGRPGLTAERFVPDPFSGEAGARLYRTGDLGRYMAGGEIDFIGRTDHQVKVRGYRIELGEVEAAVLGHEGVRDCAVVAREEGEGDRRLVAYVVAEGGREVNTSQLRESLGARLPGYMVPSRFVMLEALPLTPNGKVDRKALPVPGREHDAGDGSPVAPRDTVELSLANIWRELLLLENVGVTDNFFALGGHSLTAVRMMTRIRSSLGVELPLMALFQRPTIEKLAELIRDRGELPAQSSLVALQPDGEDTPFFCVHPIGGHVMCYWELARHMGADRPFYGLQTQDPPAGDSYATIEEMAARYVEAVREVRPEGPYLLGGWSMGGVVAYEMACQLLAQGQQVEMLALVDSRLPADGERDWVDDEVAVLSNFAYDLGLTLDGLNLTREEVGRLPEEARLSLVLEECKRAGVLPRDVELPQVARLLRIFKANARALQSYRPRPSDCPITLLAAEERLSPGRDVSAGWGTLSERVEVYHVPGNHYTVVREPHVRALAENLSARLEHPAQVV